MRARFPLAIIVIVSAFLTGCSSGQKEESSAPEQSETLAGKVDDWTFSREELARAISALPEPQRGQYDTPDGRAELTDKMMEEELYYQEGLKLGYDKDPEVVEAVNNFLRGTVIKKYFTKDIKPLARPSDDELYQYYEDNQDAFTKKPIVRAQHVFSEDRDKLLKFKKRIEDGEPMTTIAQKYSEDDLTRADGGDLGYFNPDGYIRGIGFSKEISDAAFALEPGVVSDPVKWKRGWSLIRVNELRPAEVRPFEDVKEEIADRLSQRSIERVKSIAYKELEKKHDCENYIQNELSLTQRSASELWNLAQNSKDPYQRLRSYQEIVDRFPDGEYASQALFMVGFVYAEELKDFLAADDAFNKVITEFPESDVAESAQYMLETMRKPVPDFRGVEGNKR
jgi:peptidyl-prolyl cis-trans isomerase C